MNFMNGILSPPCNSFLATFFELNWNMSEASVILLEEISSSQAEYKSVVQAAVFPSPFDFPEEKVVGKRGEDSPVGGPEGAGEVGGVCKTEAGAEADVEDEDQDFEVVGVSRYEFEGFTLSEIVRRKRLAKKNVSEGVVDTTHLPQSEFSNLQHLPLALLLEFLCWPVIEFY